MHTRPSSLKTSPSRLAVLEWIIQRLSACVLIPCSLWILLQADFTQKSTFLAWANLLSSKIILSFFQSACALHLALGTKVILVDYIPSPSLQRTLIWSVFIICTGCLCTGLFFIWIN